MPNSVPNLGSDSDPARVARLTEPSVHVLNLINYLICCRQYHALDRLTEPSSSVPFFLSSPVSTETPNPKKSVRRFIPLLGRRPAVHHLRYLFLLPVPSFFRSLYISRDGIITVRLKRFYESLLLFVVQSDLWAFTSAAAAVGASSSGLQSSRSPQIKFQTMGRSPGDDKILSYNDVVLRRSDLDILSGPYFLNDRIIEFYFSYLSSSYPSKDISLVPPSIAFWIANCPDPEDLRDFVAPLKLNDKALLIFPVNNNDDVQQAEGGSHWSLLAYIREANVFVHHDSSGRMNEAYARRLYKAVVRCLGVSGSISDAKFQHWSGSPQQLNGYDCGLFVTATARTICDWFVNVEHRDQGNLWFHAVEEQVTTAAVGGMRDEILQLIKQLMIGK